MPSVNRPFSESLTGEQVLPAAAQAIDFDVPHAAVGLRDPEEITDFLESSGDFPGEAPLRPDHRRERLPLPKGRSPGLIRRAFGFVGWVIRSLFGIASLILLLALVAAIPIVNFLALGYLLEVEGRLARTGRLRDAFPLIDLAPRLGSIALCLWLSVFPLRLLSGAAADARLIDPGSRSDRVLHALVPVLAVAIGVHLCLALARGGSLGSFFRPIKNVRWLLARWREGNYWTQAESAVREFIAGLRLRHHFSLGLRGYLGAMIWLFIPTLLFAATTQTESGVIFVTLAGAVLLMFVLSWVPFLQAHFAAENRLSAMFELGTVRELYRHSPFSWMITMLITLTLALPMYLFKIVLPPSDAMWLVTLVFIVSIFPVKVITGWAYHRALTRERRLSWMPEEALAAWRAAHPAPEPVIAGEQGPQSDRRRLTIARDLRSFKRFVAKKSAGGVVAVTIRTISRLVLVPLLAFYVFLLFFTQLIGEHGKGVLFEHHAFLLPVPF